MDFHNVNTAYNKGVFIWKKKICVLLEKGIRVWEAKQTNKRSNIKYSYNRKSLWKILNWSSIGHPKALAQKTITAANAILFSTHKNIAIKTTQLQQWWKWLNIEYTNQKPKPNKNGMPNNDKGIKNKWDRPKKKKYYWITAQTWVSLVLWPWMILNLK